MNYLFECNKCKKQEYKDIKMSEYDTEKNNQKCSVCESSMQRILEPPSMIGLCPGMYGANGWNY